jgi:branched-chain amino acid transport system ATP-binding protein
MIALDGILVRFGGLVALDAVTATFTAPVSGIIGPNGAGKTTLMNVISGFLTSTGGRVACEGHDLLSLAPHRRTRWGLRRSFQREQIAEDLTVWENLLALADHLPGSKRERSADVERAANYAGVMHIRDRLGASLNTLERRLTDVARCMIGNPKLIMFDEPAGGMTPEETARLGELIVGIPTQTKAQVLIIDHDVDLIQRICAETLVLDFGKRIAFGETRAVLADSSVQAAYLGTSEGDTVHA